MEIIDILNIFLFIACIICIIYIIVILVKKHDNGRDHGGEHGGDHGGDKPKKIKYKCDKNQKLCKKDDNGNYTSEDDCNLLCNYEGLIVFDIDDTLKINPGGEWVDCQWRAECGFPNNDQSDGITRAVNAINTAYKNNINVALYTMEGNEEINNGGDNSAYNYIKKIGTLIDDKYKTKFNNEIVKDVPNNIGFGTKDKLGTEKGVGLKKLAKNYDVPANKVVMLDDNNKNIKSIKDNGFCGITVSNIDKKCGVLDVHINQAIDFIKSGKCPPTQLNPCVIPKGQQHGCICAAK